MSDTLPSKSAGSKRTNVSIFELTPRQWVQVRAALIFWRQVAEHSRVHPSRHPKVEHLFAKSGPLSLEEIDELLAGTPNTQYITPTAIAKMLGVPVKIAKRTINRAGLVPEYTHGSFCLYRADKAEQLAKLNHA